MPSWWVCAVELEAEEGSKTIRLIRKRSPQWDGQKLQIHINLSSKQPEVPYQRNNILYEEGLSEEEAYRTRTKFIYSLREQGYGLLNPKPRKTHYVYVIDLDPAVREIARVRKNNPNSNPDMPCVYVGQTGLSLRTRRAQHKSGHKAGRR